jgi:hypothetical protein
MIEYVGVIMASLALELLLSPVQFLSFLAIAIVLGVACGWACWRSGRLIHLAHRPGAGTLILASITGTATVWSVLSLSSVENARRTILTFTEFGTGAAQSLTVETESLCRAAESLFSRLRSGTTSVPHLDCESPRATDGLRNAVESSGDALGSTIQGRLRWNQLQTFVGSLIVLAVSFGISSWRGSRSFRVQVAPTVRSYSS